MAIKRNKGDVDFGSARDLSWFALFIFLLSVFATALGAG